MGYRDVGIHDSGSKSLSLCICIDAPHEQMIVPFHGVAIALSMT